MFDSNRNKTISTSQRFCLAVVWIMTIYSSLLQNRYFKIPNGMLIFGIIFILLFLISINRKQIYLEDFFPKEEKYQLFFLIYMLAIGSIFAVSFPAHISQLISTVEFFVVMVLTAYIIRKTGTDSIHLMLLIIGIIAALIMIFNPVPLGNGRYSISIDSNPNGIGMTLASGIWAILYLQNKKKMPMLAVFVIVGFLGYALLLTGSRKSLIAAGIIIILWLAFVYLAGLRNENIIKAIAKLLLICGIMVVLISLFLDAYSGSEIAERMLRLQYEASEGDRYQFYQYGWNIFKENPVIGIGFQGFKYFAKSYSHSTFVEVPVSGGIVGSLLYFASYVVSIRKLITLFMATRREKADAVINTDIRMLLILWFAMLFYCVCIIHPYQYDSFIIFAIIFGQTGYIEKTLAERSIFYVKD